MVGAELDSLGGGLKQLPLDEFVRSAFDGSRDLLDHVGDSPALLQRLAELLEAFVSGFGKAHLVLQQQIVLLVNCHELCGQCCSRKRRVGGQCFVVERNKGAQGVGHQRKFNSEVINWSGSSFNRQHKDWK